MPHAKTRILLVDDHPIVAMGVETLLKDRAEFELVGDAKDPIEAIEAAAKLNPDLIILDLFLGGRDGFELIAKLLGNRRFPSIIIYSSLPERTHARRALRAGAKGYVMKDAGLTVLLDAIYAVSRGESYASDAVKQALVEECIGGTSAISVGSLERLSNQEIYIFRLIGSGLGPMAIAEQLGISIKTVSSHRERIKNKLGCRTARDLNRRAEEYVVNSLSV